MPVIGSLILRQIGGQTTAPGFYNKALYSHMMISSTIDDSNNPKEG